jgi:hypothetical protein
MRHAFRHPHLYPVKSLLRRGRHRRHLTGRALPRQGGGDFWVSGWALIIQEYATNVLWLVAATPQALPTGERPSNQGFRLDEKKGSLVPRCSGLAYRSD